MYYQHPDYLQHFEQRLQKLEQENQQLKQQVEQIKPIHIENINYKIQELSVKELKGTLNIGMTALTDPDEIKKWLREEDGEEITLTDVEKNRAEENT
jgi:spore germination protein PC